ncbi:hypothetical protein [Pseudomonas syringae]|uniref:hypothetical protein n=1 Tax=Pseudomonas syringae TaxID=317 RepID=UPI0002A7A8DE|nr:hypothetical protein [Pseudomonas syringae]ELP96359.1 hypothetical protein A979_22732 [Pseudomonas syringae BRIP34876]ELQ02810.1 hypothetical protein A987_11458 [Pseudomonas syringae BRIP34881]
MLQQSQVLVTGTRIDLRKRCRCSDADSGDQIIGLTAVLEPDGVTIQQSQNRLKVAGQDGLIDIQISGFGIGVESLDRAQMRRSSIVSAVLEFELDVDERNEYGNDAALPACTSSGTR